MTTTKRKPETVSRETRNLVINRAKFICERCGGELNTMSVHHRRPRKMGGSRLPDTNQPQNLLVLCGTGITGCHGWIESNRHAAVTDGYLLYQNDDPCQHPYLGHDGWWWLTETAEKMRNKPPIE